MDIHFAWQRNGVKVTLGFCESQKRSELYKNLVSDVSFACKV